MKNWLTEHFLPLWAKETVLRDNRLLQKENDKLRQENKMLHACIRGVRLGLRAAKRGGET
jgi:hypothetical protein